MLYVYPIKIKTTLILKGFLVLNEYPNPNKFGFRFWLTDVLLDRIRIWLTDFFIGSDSDITNPIHLQAYTGDRLVC